MANALKLTFVIFLIFFLMNNAKGNKTAIEEGIVHDNSLLTVSGASNNFLSHEKKGAVREEG